MSTTSNGTFGSTQEERNIYFTRVWAYLNTAAIMTRLGVTAANMAIFNKLYSHPNVAPNTLPDTLGYLELWPLHNSPSGKHDPIITKLFNQIERQHLATDPVGLENVLRAIYADIPKSALTTTDRTTLNLPLKKAKTAHTVATKNSVISKSVGIGGGDVLTKCWPSGQRTVNPSASNLRATANSKKPHKEEGYDLRTYYFIQKQGVAAPASYNVVGATVVVDTKAQLVRHLGAENTGSILYEFKQWHDPKHPNLDGPIGAVETCTIT